MNKIIVRIFGGLGNQLFCYAAARRLALVNDAELVIDDESGFKYDKLYQRSYQLDHFNIPCRKATAHERLEPFSRVRRFILKQLNKRKPFEKRTYIQQEGMDFDSRLLHLKIKGTVYIEGYWQSENYFKDMENVIRNDLRIKPPDDEQNLRMAQKINECNAVAVHVRFFDEPGTYEENNISTDYYRRAIEKMEELVVDAHYFIFSDRPEEASKRLWLPLDRITIVNHNIEQNMAYADLWLMTLCKNFIIANSTFSWWGAWLSQYKEKIVIAPGFKKLEGVSWWGFKGLLPEEWIKL